jgi:hypothetical protein
MVSNLKSSIDVMTRNIFNSSAKCKLSETWILAHKSLIKIMKTEFPKWSLVALQTSR